LARARTADGELTDSQRRPLKVAELQQLAQRKTVREQSDGTLIYEYRYLAVRSSEMMPIAAVRCGDRSMTMHSIGFRCGFDVRLNHALGPGKIVQAGRRTRVHRRHLLGVDAKLGTEPKSPRSRHVTPNPFLVVQCDSDAP